CYQSAEHLTNLGTRCRRIDHGAVFSSREIEQVPHHVDAHESFVVERYLKDGFMQNLAGGAVEHLQDSSLVAILNLIGLLGESCAGADTGLGKVGFEGVCHQDFARYDAGGDVAELHVIKGLLPED